MSGDELALTIAAVLFSTAGQVSFKAAMAWSSYRLLLFALGVGLMVLSVMACALVLRTLPLTSLIPITALVHITTPLAAVIIFKEKVRPQFWIGTSCIVAGIIMTLATSIF